MGDLVNYSVETDEVVLLIFRDGTRMRVPTNRLEQYLRPRDAARVGSAVKLRHAFLRHHMPKVAVALAAGGMVAMFTFATKPLATLWVGDARSAAETPEPGATRIVQDTGSTSTTPSRKIGLVQPAVTSQPVVSPKPTPKVTPKPGLVQTPVNKAQNVTNILPQVTPQPTPQLLPTPAPSVSPAPSLTPTVAPTPAPSPAPGTIVQSDQAANGQVLGDSTGPANQSTPIPKS